MDISQIDIAHLRLVLYALVGLLVVVVMGLALYLRQSAQKVQQQRRALMASQDFFDGVPRPRLSLHLVHDEASGELAVEAQGKRYHRLAEIDDPAVRRQVVAAAAELIQFTGVLGDAPPTPPPPLQALQWREELRQPVPVQPTAADADATAEFLRKASRLAEQPGPQRVTLLGSIERRLHGTKQDQPEALSLTQEIDKIIQRRLTMARGLQGRKLHLLQTPEGQVVFEFDGVQYPTADDIPNLTARQLVQDAIREWEETR